MLMNLHKTVWTEALTMADFKQSQTDTAAAIEKMSKLADQYTQRVKEESSLTKEELKTRYVGKLDPKKHLEELGKKTLEDNIVQTLVEMLDKEASFAEKKECASEATEMDLE